MKKSLNIIILFFANIILCMTLSSCDLEISDNGDLDGYWQLTKVDSIESGTITSMKGSNIFWAIQADVLQVRNINYHNRKILFRFTNKNGQLNIYNPLLEINKDERVEVTNDSILKPLYIQSANETFTIDQLTNSNMILSNNMLRIYFKKH